VHRPITVVPVRFSLDQIVIDCRRPAVLARFWADLLGGQSVDRPVAGRTWTPPASRGCRSVEAGSGAPGVGGRPYRGRVPNSGLDEENR
jgi:hypothetical protein